VCGCVCVCVCVSVSLEEIHRLEYCSRSSIRGIYIIVSIVALSRKIRPGLDNEGPCIC
jgi:hypothetical protein